MVRFVLLGDVKSASDMHRIKQWQDLGLRFLGGV
jgi:hypothetical protein